MSMRPLAAALGLAAMSLWMSACGPGIGGTGTESVSAAFAHYGAQASPVCGSGLAPQLGCTGTTAMDDPSSLLYADATSRYSVIYTAQSVLFEDRCQQLRFEGIHGITPSHGERYYGLLTTRGAAPEPASLAITPGVEPAQQALLQDFAQRPISGPVSLSRRHAPLGAAACP